MDSWLEEKKTAEVAAKITALSGLRLRQGEQEAHRIARERSGAVAKRGADDVEEGDNGTETGASENPQNLSPKPLWNYFFNKAARLSLNERLKHSLVTPILPTVSKLMVYESLKFR